MSASFTTYGRDQMLAAVLNADTFIPPAQWWLALCVATPHLNDDGTMLVEPDPSCGYARIAVPLGSANWTSIGVGEYSNANAWTAIGALTADAGLCMGWAFTDSATIGEGNAWAVGNLADPFYMASGQTLSFDNATLGLYD